MRIVEDFVFIEDGEKSVLLDFDWLREELAEQDGVELPVLEDDELAWIYDVEEKQLKILIEGDELIKEGEWEIGEEIWRDRVELEQLFQEENEVKVTEPEIAIADLKSVKKFQVNQELFLWANEPLQEMSSLVVFVESIQRAAENWEPALSAIASLPPCMIVLVATKLYSSEIDKADLLRSSVSAIAKNPDETTRDEITSTLSDFGTAIRVAQERMGYAIVRSKQAEAEIEALQTKEEVEAYGVD